MKFRVLVCALTALILIAVSVFSVSAVKIDGFLDDKEWKSVEKNVLISSADISNGNVCFGVVSIICDESTDKLTFGFKATLSEPITQNSDYGVGISFNSGEFFYVMLSGVSDYDTSKFGVIGAVGSTHEMSFSAEVVVSLKYGLDSVDKLDLRFVDGNSVPTKVYSIPLDAVVPTAANIQTSHTQAVVRTEKPTRDISPKTTKRAKHTASSKDNMTQSVYQHTQSSATYEQSSAVQGEKYAEETTVMTLRSIKIRRGFSYAAIAALIILAFAICVLVNLKNDKEKSGK